MVYLPKEEEGQNLAEYGMLLGLIAVVVMAALTVIRGSLFDIFDIFATSAEGWTLGGTA